MPELIVFFRTFRLCAKDCLDCVDLNEIFTVDRHRPIERLHPISDPDWRCHTQYQKNTRAASKIGTIIHPEEREFF